MKLSKCIGIISYFPDGEKRKRDHRIFCFKNLLETLNRYFKLPIVVIAQNWKNDDITSIYNYGIKVYRFDQPLGITSARIMLREKLLENHMYDYYIMLDDDTNIVCNSIGVETYLNTIDQNPDKIGLFSNCWFRLFAISRKYLKLTNFDFIKNYEPGRGEIWEDVSWFSVWKRIYPEAFYKLKNKNIREQFIQTEKDQYTTWYKSNFSNIRENTKRISEDWYKSLT